MARANVDRMMRILLPYLLRQRQQRQWLEQSYGKDIQVAREKDVLERERMGIRSKDEREREARSQKNKVILQLLKVGAIGVEDLDRPLLEYLSRTGEVGVPLYPGAPTISPEMLEEKKRPYGEMTARMSAVLERGGYLPTEEVGPATGLIGSKRVMDFLEQAERVRKGKEERGLRAEELEVKRAEVGLEGEEKSKKQLEDEFKVFDQKEKTFKAQLDSIGVGLALTTEELKMSDDPRAVKLRAQLEEVWRRKLNNANQRLGLLEKKKADGIISKLRDGGATAEALEKYKEKFKKKENLTEEEYQYIMLSLR